MDLSPSNRTLRRQYQLYWLLELVLTMIFFLLLESHDFLSLRSEIKNKKNKILE